MNIKININNFSQNLPPSCKLIVVSKTQPLEKIQEAYDAGHRVFGENKVQELVPKAEALPNDIQWHLIGHLQTNKVKYIVPFVHLIHSVDSVKLLEEIHKQAKKIGRVIDCLLQVHIAEEETKFGFSRDEVMNLVNNAVLQQLDHISIIGLMGMATFTDDQHQVRKEFQSLKNLFDEVKHKPSPRIDMRELSMGMSGDYKIAVEEGSTMIRIGTAIFGERNYNPV